MSQPLLKLYTFHRSQACWRIRIALNIKKVNYESVIINLQKGEQLNQEYRNVNPHQAIPALDAGNGRFIIESMAIAEYLEDAFPMIKLFPVDPFKKALVRGFCEVINSGIQPYANLRKYDWIQQRFTNFDRIAYVQQIMYKGLQSIIQIVCLFILKALEQITKENHGKYSFGDDLTLADAFLIPQLNVVKKFEINLGEFQNLQKIQTNLKKLPEFIAAQPDHQPDYQPH